MRYTLPASMSDEERAIMHKLSENMDAIEAQEATIRAARRGDKHGVNMYGTTVMLTRQTKLLTLWAERRELYDDLEIQRSVERLEKGLRTRQYENETKGDYNA